MKKLLVILLVVSTLFAIGCDNKPPHQHIWDKGEVKKPATCVDNGEMLYTCIDGDATKVEIIKASEEYHNYVEGTCTHCNYTEEFINNAVARVGKKYYQEFYKAVNEAQNIDKVEDRVIEVIVENVPHSKVDHIEICRSLTINANGADFNHDGTDNLAFFTYSTQQGLTPATGEVNVVINDAKNLSLWGQFLTLPNETQLNVTVNNVHNEGLDKLQSKGYLVMFRGPDNTKNASINLTVENSSAKICDNGIHFMYNGNVTIKNCEFEEVAVPVNFAHKGTEGNLDLTVEDCTFINTGVIPSDIPEDCTDQGKKDLPNYSAPIRLTQTGEGSNATILIKNNTVTGTRSTKGDVLLVDDRDNRVIRPLTANFVNNKTDLKVLAEKGEEFVEVKANETKELQAGTKGDNSSTVTQ